MKDPVAQPRELFYLAVGTLMMAAVLAALACPSLSVPAESRAALSLPAAWLEALCIALLVEALIAPYVARGTASLRGFLRGSSAHRLA